MVEEIVEIIYLDGITEDDINVEEILDIVDNGYPNFEEIIIEIY